MVRVLGVSGSPRPYGNTERLLRVALEAARAEGAEVELTRLYDYNLGHCIGCLSDVQEACQLPCVLEDDGGEIYEKVESSDGIILATPVYWFMPSSATKVFIDRLTAFENMIVVGKENPLEGKVCGVIAVGNDEGAVMAASQLVMALNQMGVAVPPWGVAYFVGQGDALGSERAVLDAANVGVCVARAARLLRGGGPWYDTRVLGRVDLARVREAIGAEYRRVWPERERRVRRLLNRHGRNVK